MKSFKKVILTGVLALGPIIGASAVSAAPYTVNENDTLSTISQKFGIDLNALLRSNLQISNPNVICPGMSLNIPNMGQGSGKGFIPGFTFKPVPGTNNGSGADQGADNGADQGADQGADNGADQGADQGADNGADQGADQGADNGADQGAGSGAEAGAGNNAGGGSQAGGSGSEQQAGDTAKSEFAAQVVNLVNQERAKAGLQPLTTDDKLAGMALDKAKDMHDNKYFDHNSPTYGSPFDMMKSYGIQYSYAGENIAMGQRTPEEVMNGWMNSEGHRQNILNPNFNKIGVAYYNGYWVQEFIKN